MKKITITLNETQLEYIDMAISLAINALLDRDDEDKAFCMEGLQSFFCDMAEKAKEE